MMNNSIKYIYFEIYWVDGVDSVKPKIQNENILLIKPHTSSVGIWGYRNVTERKNMSTPTFVTVSQNWIDLEKYYKEDMPNSPVYKQLNIWVQLCLKNLNIALRELKINSLEE